MIASMVYKCVHKEALEYLSECCMPKTSEGAQTRSITTWKLYELFARSFAGKGDFRVSGPIGKVWNGLPDNLRDPQLSLNVFHKRLKAELFRRAFKLTM